MKRGKRHWFHCTTENRGPRWTAERRRPATAGADEPATPRLCVAASVARCFAARLMEGDVYVYRTAAPRRAVRPSTRLVWDATITGERWLIPPVEMVLVEKIPLEEHAEASRRVLDYVLEHRSCSVWARVWALEDAVRVLGPARSLKSDERFLASVIPYLRSKGLYRDA